MSRPFIALCCFLAMLSAIRASAEDSLEIRRPVDGAVHYQRSIDVEGVASSPRVLVLTQSMLGDAPWRVGAMIQPEDGIFRASLELDGSEFDRAVRVVALGVSPSHAARLGRPGTLLRRPPTGLPRSKMIRLTLAGTSRPAADEENLPERILLPVDGSTVGPTETIVVEGTGENQPVILIRAAAKGSRWYMQPSVELLDGGHSAVQVRFGSDRSTDGEQFLIRLAIPKDNRQFFGVTPGQSISDLPSDVAYGRDIVVRYDSQKPATTTMERLRLIHAADQTGERVQILVPSSQAPASRRVKVAGRFCSPMVPVLMVRRADENREWYVQPKCALKGDQFECRIYLGQIGTKAGTQFEVIAMLVPADKSRLYPSGKTVMQLPKHAVVSQPIVLTHNGQDD